MRLPDFSGARVLVAGDLMLDRYWHGPAERVSPEAPVPVVHVHRQEARPGGAGNVALNLARLGARPQLAALVGEDEAGSELAGLLSEAGVAARLTRLAERPTITKLRILSRHQQLLRLDFEGRFEAQAANALLEEARPLLDEADLMILSDYGKGTLGDPRAWIQAARAAGRPVLVDPKGRNFEVYRGATGLTPNLAEFEAVVGPCADETGLEEKGRALVADLNLDWLLVTRGEAGMSLIPREGAALHLPTRAREVYDVTGAGDTVIATLGAALAVAEPLESAVALANLAAGLVVAKLGTAGVTPAELERRLAEQRLAEHGVVDEETLVALVTAARRRGERIVFTNGCFDLLHAGHVTYLEEASRLGDRLIVAVNADRTVRRLKGPGRPVNPLAQRMHVLAALGFVDWVVPFEEETPERLICRFKPDLLVKGGDNDPDKIPGARCVREAGGEVRVLSYLDGISTTAIVERMQGRD